MGRTAADILTGWPDIVANGRPALRFRTETPAGAAARGSDDLVLHMAPSEKTVGIDTDPATGWQDSDHGGWPVMLVCNGTLAGDRVATRRCRAWRNRATVARRRTWGARP